MKGKDHIFKVFPGSAINSQVLENAQKEFRIARQCIHPYIMRAISYTEDEDGDYAIKYKYAD